jgi:hypothetical protein
MAQMSMAKQVCGRGRQWQVQVCGHGHYCGYSHMGTDVIAEKIVDQKLDFDYRVTYSSRGKNNFLY